MTDRADAIGGSDVAAIMGVSPWRTRWDVYLEKTRDPSYAPQEETLAMRLGSYMEDFLAAEYERETGRTVVERQAFVGLPGYPYLRGTLDGRVQTLTSAAADDGIWEAKTAGSDRDWANGPPDYYLTQCYFYLALTSAPWCDLTILFPRADLRTYRIDADETMQRGILAACVAFWRDHVVPRIPPPMDASPAASRWLARMPADDEDVLEAGAELEEVIEKLSGVREALKALGSSESLLENQAKALIGEHQKAVGRGWHVSYKRTKPYPMTKWKEAAGEMRTMMEMAGLAESAEEAVARWTETVENRRPLIVKREAEA